MMKVVRFLIAVASVGIFSTSAMAIGVIDLDVTVNPNYGGSFSGLGDTTGTALYNFGVSPTSTYGASFVSLAFERDIFASIGVPSIISGPLGFSLSVDTSDPTVTTIDGGALLPGEYARFTVDYTLTDTNAYYLGTDPNNVPATWTWDLDGPDAWSQAASAVNLNGARLVAVGGGSAAIPEPTGLVLLGSGLLSLGLLRSVRSKSSSKG